MKYGYTVKKDGVLYKPGEDVPDAVEKSSPVKEKPATTQRKRQNAKSSE